MPPETIADTDALLRRLALNHVKPNGVLTSVAYQCRGFPDEEISVNLERLSSVEHTMMPKPGAGVARVEAGPVRQLGLRVEHDPVPDNYSHSLIKGASTIEKCRQLSEITTILVFPRPRI